MPRAPAAACESGGAATVEGAPRELGLARQRLRLRRRLASPVSRRRPWRPLRASRARASRPCSSAGRVLGRRGPRGRDGDRSGRGGRRSEPGAGGGVTGEQARRRAPAPRRWPGGGSGARAAREHQERRPTAMARPATIPPMTRPGRARAGASGTSCDVIAGESVPESKVAFAVEIAARRTAAAPAWASAWASWRLSRRRLGRGTGRCPRPS